MSDQSDRRSEPTDDEPNARTRLLASVYDELRRISRRVMRGANARDSLQGTALVHEALLKLLAEIDADTDASVFLCKAARVMRTIAIDHWRARRTLRRGGGRERLSISVVDASDPHALDPDVLALDAALQKLEKKDPDLARLIELRFFAGFTTEEAAGIERVTTRTMERRWQIARAWLERELRDAGE